MGKDNLLFLRRMHGRMHEWCLNNQKKLEIRKRLLIPFGRKVYIIGSPEHTNLGDSAIVLAQKEFIKNCGYNESNLKEITYKEYNENRELIVNLIKKQHLVCLLGGGNMGDEWINEEIFRRNVVMDFTDNPMVIFPQTIFYTPTERGQKEQKLSVKYYNGNEKLVLVAREKESFKIMKDLYPNTKCILTPDIVLSSTKANYDVKDYDRTEVLLCMRRDSEKYLSEEECQQIEQIVRNTVGKYRKMDMYSDEVATRETRKELVGKKMQEVSRAKLVITDRLHGMIFSAITETPCIVFSNYNQKVSGTYEWIKQLPYICFIQSVSELKEAIKKLLTIEKRLYDNSTWIEYFDELKNAIEKYS